MSDSGDNRALGRIGARILTPAEEAVVTGGSGSDGTLTVCTVPNRTASSLDGDLGECG